MAAQNFPDSNEGVNLFENPENFGGGEELDPVEESEEVDAAREEAAEDPEDLRNPSEVTGDPGNAEVGDEATHDAGPADNLPTV